MEKKNMKFVAYYRVSTQQQGRSGLGLEAQQIAVKAYAKGELIAEYTEVESGKRDKRPELNKALTECKVSGATLVIAKLDRLSRNVSFINNLMESNVKFICCDMPEANELVIGIMAQLAQFERKMISERTRSALNAAKQRGTKLGNPKMIKGSEAAQKHAKLMQSQREYVKPHPDKIEAIKAMRKSGTSITEITGKSEAILGRQYSRVQVWRLLK